MITKMATKATNLLAAGIFVILAVFFSLGTISAKVDFVNVTNNGATANPGDSVTISFYLQNDDTGDFTNISFNTPITLTSADGYTISSASSVSGSVTNISQNSTSGQMSLTFSIPSTAKAGNYTGQLNVTGTYTNTKTYTLDISLNVTVDDFCKYSAINDSDLTLNVDIKNRGEGDDNEWVPLDTIEVEVELENDKSDIDLDDVVFEIGLFELGSTNNIADEMMWKSEDDEKFEVGDVDAGDDATHTFVFRVDPSEVKDKKYVLKVKAYPDKEEDETCIDYSADLADSSFGNSAYNAIIDITKESKEERMVVIDTEELPSPLEASCGQQVTLTVPIYNIGDQNFPDQIKATLNNQELGLDLEEVIEGDLDEGDMTEATFVFNIPTDAEEKQYLLQMATLYDYDSDKDRYKETSEETFNVYLKVEGNCISPSTASVGATLESGGKAGEELIVKSTITNTGDKVKTYTISVSGYTDWADSATLDTTTLTLNPSESKEITIRFNVKDDAEGEKFFSIEVLGEKEELLTQTVSVPIEKSGFNLKELVKKGDKPLWALGILNIALLIVIIIIIALRVAGKRKTSAAE